MYVSMYKCTYVSVYVCKSTVWLEIFRAPIFEDFDGEN